MAHVAREFDLTESALRTWVEHARADRTKGRTGLKTEEREKLRRLRKEVWTLRTDCQSFRSRPRSPRVYPGVTASVRPACWSLTSSDMPVPQNLTLNFTSSLR